MYEPAPFHYEIFCTKTLEHHSFDRVCGADVFIEENYEYLNANDNTHVAGYLGNSI